MTSYKSNSAPRPVPPPAGGPAKPASAYSRFIPREELAGFASWTPDAFAGFQTQNADGSLNPAAAARAAAAERRQGVDRRNPPPAPPTEPAPPATDEWLARVQAARQQGYQEGYRDGLQALEAAKRQYAAQVTAQVAQVVASFDEQMQSLEARMASAVLDTALALARRVVRSELALRPEGVAQVAQEAVGAVMLSARHLRLRLHPQDLALIEPGAGAALRAREVVLQADAAVTPGGCVVESDLGQVDARIESRWAHAVAVFGASLPWQPAPEVAVAAEPEPVAADTLLADPTHEDRP
jgi:flagellar assembly protein FliH